jgi:hypothetical protein
MTATKLLVADKGKKRRLFIWVFLLKIERVIQTELIGIQTAIYLLMMSTSNQTSTHLFNETFDQQYTEAADPIMSKDELEIFNLLGENLTSAELKDKLIEMEDEIEFDCHLGDEETINDIKRLIPVYKEVLRLTLEKEMYEATKRDTDEADKTEESSHYYTKACSSLQCRCDGRCYSYDG